MQRFRAIAGARRARGLARLGAMGLMAASLAGASPASEPAAPDPARAAAGERRVVCTPFGCRPLPPASWTWVVAFGAASVAAGWLGRRQHWKLPAPRGRHYTGS
jgi:hypothetical protein